ncbi:MAG TPA: wax ester/triacylglycerol synthase family O-acyltransferase, partial [Acidimicrobiales bacterium]|nr:wax ester/triacylglycerol synthase family O-acyltransferase [Acidimicrobiales bacterium]
MGDHVEVAGKRVEILRPNDAFFLNAEVAGAPQHVGGVAIIDSSPKDGHPVNRVDVKERIGRAIDAGTIPRLRQRLARSWGSFARPAWVEVSDVLLDRHVREHTVAAPGGQRQLEEALEAILADPLDRSYPLWELWLLDGLSEGRQAIVLKVHHAVADGIGVLALVEALLDGEPAPPGDGIEGRRGSPPNVRRIFASTLVSQLTAPARDLFAGALRFTQDPADAVRAMLRTADGVWALARAGRAAPTPLNRGTGSQRRILLADVPRSLMRAARRHYGATDNDVILAVVAGGIHDWMTSEGIDPPPTLRTVVPVSTRSRRSREPGSWTATLTVDLPAGAIAPRERLRQVVEATAAAKRSNQRHGSQFVMHAVGSWAPPRVHGLFARFSYRGEWFNLIVSNVPGVRRPRSLCGAPVVAAYPIIPLVPGVGLTVASMRWDDRVTIGFVADPSSVGDLDKLAASTLGLISDLG